MADGLTVNMCQANIPNGRSIYDFITANNLYGIHSLLNPLTIRHRQSIVCQKVFNKTLLGHACELGFKDIVKYLLDECEADISERYTHNGILISPLRLSIDNLDVGIICLLIKRRVLNVDKSEASNCCAYAFKKNYYSLSSILNHCTNPMKQVDYTFGCAKACPQRAPLHFYNTTEVVSPYSILSASACGNIDGIKNFLSCGMDPKIINDSEENALCTAITYGQSNAEYFLLNYRIFSIKDHVLALELCGATLIVFLSAFSKGLRCWRRAIRIRTEECFGVSDKFPDPPLTDLGSEFSSEEQLDKIMNNKSELYIQSLLVFVRLLSHFKPIIKYAFLGVAQRLALRNDLLQAINVLSELSTFPSLPIRDWDCSFQMATTSLKNLLGSHFYSDPNDVSDFLFKFKYLINFIKGIDWKALFSDENQFLLVVYKHLLLIVLANIMSMQNLDLSTNDQIWIEEAISSLLRFHSDPYPTTLLHLAMEESTDTSLIEFLLSCSADANCTDKGKNTPLHMVSCLSEDEDHILDVVDLLTHAGGHIDAVNIYNITPIMWLDDIDVIVNPLKFISLQCLAAQTIHEHEIKIPEIYPKILVSFIKLHSNI